MNEIIDSSEICILEMCRGYNVLLIIGVFIVNRSDPIQFSKRNFNSLSMYFSTKKCQVSILVSNNMMFRDRRL